MSRKRKQRERELEAALQEKQEAARYAAKPNESIFFVDNSATLDAKTLARRAKRAKKKQSRQAPSSDTVSKTETILVERAVVRALRKREMNTSKKKEGSRGHKEAILKRKSQAEEIDLWDGDDVDSNTNTKIEVIQPTVEVALPGQSYNPSFEDHQAVVLAAVAVEEKLVKKKQAEDSWWAKRKADQEAAAEFSDDSQEESGDSDSESESNSESRARNESRSIVNGERMSRAQRNKQKRRKVAEAEALNAKAVKRQRHELTEIKRIRREVEREARLAEARRVVRAASKADAKAKPPIPTRPPSVALSDELVEADGTLRKSRALQTPAELLRNFQDTAAVTKHQPLKKRIGTIERKKPPRRKYRGARLIARYRKPPWFVNATSSLSSSSKKL